jgi:hypothetical protein
MAEGGQADGTPWERADLSLEQIENDRWGDAPPGATRLVASVHALRRVPIGALNVEDLRLLIGQHTGLQVLLPQALALLERDPLVEGDLYPGDLLSAALHVPAPYWEAHKAERVRMRSVAEQAVAALTEPADPVDAELLARTRAFVTASS